ncbi:Ribonuclease H [Spironucleus salmonicida]|nr:Ribonuclease H [Spironucleus salmonicida]
MLGKVSQVLEVFDISSTTEDERLQLQIYALIADNIAYIFNNCKPPLYLAKAYKCLLFDTICEAKQYIISQQISLDDIHIVKSEQIQNNKINLQQIITKTQLKQYSFGNNKHILQHHDIGQFDIQFIQYDEFERIMYKKFYINAQAVSSKGALGIIVKENNCEQERFSQGFSSTTSNRMILIGMIIALESLKANESFIIGSSLMYPLECFSKFLDGFIKKSFAGIKNSNLIKQILFLMVKKQCIFSHIRSTLNDETNLACFELTTQKFNRYTNDDGGRIRVVQKYNLSDKSLVSERQFK